VLTFTNTANDFVDCSFVAPYYKIPHIHLHIFTSSLKIVTIHNLVFKHPVALQCLHTISLNNAAVYFLYLTLNMTCFGHRWPSSGVPLCQTCYTAFSIVRTMRVFEHFGNKMFLQHSTVVC
jgi:hypothetical protein